MKVLVLGANGFIGKHLCHLLEESKDIEFLNPSSKEVNLTEQESIEKYLRENNVQKVVNLAAISFVNSGLIETMYQINSFGTLNLVRAINEVNEKIELYHFSTANIYGNTSQVPTSEDVRAEILNHYASSKELSENLLKLEAKCPYVVFRPFNCIGPGQQERFLVPKLVKAFKNRDPELEMGDQSIKRDFVDVRDAARMVYNLMFQVDIERINKKAINLCSGKATAISSILQALSEITGHETLIKINPKFIRKNDLKLQQGDNSFALKLLDFKYKYDLHNTLTDMLEKE